MPFRPSKIFRWATSPSALIAEPPESRKDNGWKNPQQPPAGFFNWLFQHVGTWFAYLDDKRFEPLANLTVVDSLTDAGERWHDVCHGTGAGTNNYGMFLAVGVGDTGVSRYGTSIDGQAWTRSSEIEGGDEFRACAHGGSGAFGSRMFVIVGSDPFSTARIWTSPDDSETLVLTSQTPANTGGATSILLGVAWDPVHSLWCAVGRDGAIMTSPDAITWTARTPAASFAENYYGVRCNPVSGRLVAVGDDREIQISDSGGVPFMVKGVLHEGWTRRYSDAGSPLDSLVHVPGTNIWVAGSTSSPNVLVSLDDGITWRSVPVLSTVEGTAAGGVESLVELNGAVAAIVKASGVEKRVMALSYDGGLTWPKQARLPAAEYGYVHAAAITDGERAVFVGGLTNFGTSFIAASLHAQRST